MKRALAAGGIAVALAGIGGIGWWQGSRWFGAAAAPVASQPVRAARAAAPAPRSADDSPGVTTLDGGGQPLDAGTTPMRDRIAVIGILNKRNGVSRELTLRPGEALRYGDAVVRLRACEQTAPWEQERLTGAFVQLFVRGFDKRWRRSFSGWLFKERPALNVAENAVYDVWTKSCTMSFPATGPDTAAVSASSAKKSAASAEAAEDDGGDDNDGGDGPAASIAAGSNPANASPSNTM